MNDKTDLQIKSYEMEQNHNSQNEKVENYDAYNSGVNRPSVRINTKQESLKLKPVRKKRRQLTGW